MEIGVILDAGEEFLAWDDCANAGAVYRSVSREMLEHYDTMLDEDGRLTDVMDRCVEGTGTMPWPMGGRRSGQGSPGANPLRHLLR